MKRKKPTHTRYGGRKLREQLCINMPCPINRRAPVKMSWNAYKKACTHHSRSIGKAWQGMKGLNVCDFCEIPDRIKKGQAFQVPEGITIYTEEEHQELLKRVTQARALAELRGVQ